MGYLKRPDPAVGLNEPPAGGWNGP